MKRNFVTATVASLLACALIGAPVSRAQQQPGLSGEARSEVSDMMHDAYSEVQKHYFDPKLQGLDWNARYQQYSARIPNARDLGEGFRIVAAFLSGLKDSHTFFIPPARATRYEFGYRYALVGNSCFITQLRPKTDAESKLHIGDQVVNLNGYRIDRGDFHDAEYYFNILAPQAQMTFDVRSPDGQERKAVVNAALKPLKKTMDLTQGEDLYDLVRQDQNEDHATRSRIIEKDDVAIWKLQQFDLDIDGVEKGFGMARKHKTLILDLRGNGGGSTTTLGLMVGSVFPGDTKIADRVGRNSPKPMIGKHHGKTFDGKLIVLVDSGSASSSELFARVVQLNHRGTVIGDKTAGAVMEAWPYSESQGADSRIFYEFSVTDANLIMSDGQSLEKTGVVPDELLLPTGADLAAGRDPVLARAAELAGVKLDPVEAGKLFPYEWLPL
jgi:carboxyl-terminal processing protease